ncbi:MAG TPA: YebC/PmpR family DNA-binding transcriptional regulator [Longimicrobiales bacterium]|nr:YebC/PmpR family DNA-binding transcriptional regulator [Longimicrobiales bacterium]
MAGHSKWAQIKRKKAVNDNKRGQHFTKLIREITVAARAGGGDPGMNPRLRLAVDTAKAANMPADNIDRAIKKGTGELEGVDYQEVSYEGYGPGGVAIYIETLTDNANRTVSDIRYVLSRNDGSMGTSGSVAWQFERKGQIYVDATRYDEDSTMLAALEAGAEDLRRDDDVYVVSTELASFAAVQDGLRRAGIDFEDAELAMVAMNTVSVSGAEAQKLLKLLDALDDLDDVQKVHSNADIDEAAYAEADA